MAKEYLFHFHSELGDWCYSSGRASVSYLGYTFAPQPIRQTDYKRGSRDAEIEVEMPLTLEPAASFVLSNPARAIWLSTYQNGVTPVLKFSGKVVSASFKRKKALATLKARAIGETGQTEVPLRRFSNLCPFNLGDSDCGADLEALKVTVPATAFDGDLTITHANIGAEDEGYFSYGFARQGDVVACVVNHSGNSVSLLVGVGLKNGAGDADIDLYPGCDKLLATCDGFGNKANFGGFPHIPAPDPISGEF